MAEKACSPWRQRFVQRSETKSPLDPLRFAYFFAKKV